MGVNALRTSHNPPSPEMIDVCERLGIVMMVEAFDTWRTPQGRRTTTAASSTPTATPTSRRWSTRPSNSPAVDHVVDRQRDPRLHQHRRRRRWPSGSIDDVKLDRHDAADRDRLRQVPQRARPPAPPPTRSLAHARRARPQLQHRRRRWTRCTPATRPSSSSSPSPPRRPRPAASTRTPTSSTPARTTRPASARPPPTTTTSPPGR